MKKLAPLKSVRKYCLWCMNEQSSEVKLCPSKDCPLFEFRFGKRKKGKSVQLISNKTVNKALEYANTKEIEDVVIIGDMITDFSD